MRKLTLLISMLFLSLGMAWAQSSEVKVTDLNDLSNEKVYFIESKRAFLMYNTSANDAGLSTSTSTAVQVSRTLTNYNYWFSIKTIDGNRYLYSIGAGKYITNTGGFSDQPEHALGIKPATTQGGVDNTNYNWMLTIGGKGLNSQDPGQHKSGILVDGWTNNDKGNCYRIVDVESVLPFELCSSYDEITNWYKLGIRDDNLGPSFLKYDAAKQYIPTPSSYNESEKEAFAWAFVVTPGAGISIVNKAAGATKVLSAPVAPTEDKNSAQLARMVEKDDASGNIAWDIIMPTTHGSTKEFSFYVQHPTAKSYAFNRQNINGENVLCYWTGRDTGSSIWTEDIQGDAVVLKNLVSELNALFTNKPKGDAVGQYSSSYANYESEFNRISGYASTLADNAIGAEIRADIAILNAIKESYSINEPVADKYYTFSNNDKYITSKVVNNRIACGANDAYAIYYFDGSGLKSFATGKYIGLNESYWTFSDSGSAIQFVAAVNGVAGKFNINSGNRWLHLTVNTDGTAYVNRCQNNTCGNDHNWVIEEVTDLPVAQSGNSVYYTLADAKANVKAGETLTLFVDTNDTIELPIGVILDKNGHSADNVTVATPVAKIGEQGYATLAEAITAASAGSTITFVDNIKESVTLNKNVTIDGANKQYKYTGTMTLTAGITVAVKNLNFVNALVVENDRKSTGTYTFTNCNFDGENQTSPIYALSIRQAKSVVVDNCTIKNYSNGGIYLRSSVTNLTVKDVTVENCPSYAVYFASGVTNATIEGLTVKNSNNGILWTSAGARTLKLKNCKFGDVKTAINSNGGAYVVTANVQGVDNDFGTAVLSDNVKCVLAEDATLAATTADLNVTTNVEGKEVAYQDGKYSVVVKRDPAGSVAYRADVTDKEDREGIAILLKDPYAKKSLVVKVYNGETLMFTCTRRNIDDEGKVMFPVTANTTANIVLWGKESGSWNNEIHVTPTELNVPNRVEIWADEVLVQNYTHESGNILGTNIEKYLALDCVKKFDAKIGNTGCETLAAAIENAQASETIVLLRDVAASDIITINKTITLDGNGKTLTSTAGRAINVETEGKVVINNLTVNAGERAFNIINKAATVELNDVTATASNNAVMIATSAGAANVTINGCDFKGLAVVNVAGAKSNVAIKNSTITNVDNNPNENYGAITVWSSAEEAVVNVENTDITFADDSKKAYVFPANATVTGVDEVGYIVVTIGDAGYDTLAEAVEKAKAGETIEFVRNVTASEIITINKAITLNGNGKTLTYTGSGASARAIDVKSESNGANLTVKNLTIDCTASYCQRGINYNTNGKLTLESVTVKGTNVTYALNLPGSSDNATVTINNSSLTGNIALNVWGENSTITAENSVFTSVDNSTAENYAAVVLNNDGSTVANGTTVTINGGSITALDENGDLSNAVRNSTSTGTINVSDATTVTGIYSKPVAIVTYGSDQFYSCATLQAAIDKAIATNGTVKLIADVEATEIITVNAPVVIDGNGKKLTSTAGRAINVETEGKVVINNLTVKAAERAFNIINKPATVELNGVTATASNNAVMIATSAGAANVTINGCDFKGLAVVNVAGAESNVAIKNSTITNVDNNPNENYGAITVWSSAEKAVVNVENTTITVAGDSKKAYVFPANATVTGVDEVGQIVAMIGDAGYETLTKAIAEAKEGQTVKMVYDVNLSEILVINKAITLDGNNKTLTSTAERAINVSGANGVTIKNLTIDAKGQRAINVIQNATNVTIDGVTATAANYTVNVAGSAANAVVAIKNSTLNGLCTVNVAAAGAKVTVDNSTVNCNDNNTTVGESYAALSLNKEAVGGSIVATNSTVNVTEGSDSMKGRNSAENGTVTINNSTEDVAVMVAAITYEGTDNYHAFATLKAAVEFAQAGQTVTLLRDVTGAGVVINKNLTIDFNKKTYSFNEGVGSTGTESNGFQILKGNTVTLKNGTLNVAAEAADKFYILVQNYANLTVENMTLDGKYLDKWVATDGDSYVLSNNSGTVNVIGSTIKANDEGSLAFAMDACLKASYEAPVVTVDANSVVTGNVEVSATLNMNGTLDGTIVINGADGKVNGAAEGLNVITNVADHKVVNNNGAYTVAAKNYVAQVGEANKYETFAAAVAAAKAGETITLIADATEAATVVLTKNLTIDGAGHTFTGAIEFKNANGYFTVKKVKFNGAGTRVYALKSQASVTSLTVEDCEATGYTYGFLYANKAVANAIVNNVTVKDVNYGVHSAYGTNVTLNNFVAENVAYGVMVQNYGTRNVVLNNCSFTGSKNQNPLYVWERNQTNKITFNFKGVNEMGKADFCASAMAVINAEAVAGTKVCGTLAEAVEAANEGETVTLLRNVELSTYLTIDKSITLNLGEYNITRNGGTALYVNGDVEVAINGTTGKVTGAQALFVNNGLVKVNGGHFYGTSSNAEAVYVKGNGEVEIKDGTFEGDTNAQYYYVLNKLDADRATSSITVYGGTFVGFNPADNAAEGQGTNFVAAGLMAVDNGNGTFGIAKANVKMGDSYYATLAEAIAAIGAGDVVIELLADATLDYGAREAYGTAETASVTINGNGKTLTLNQTNSDWSSFGLAAGKVVLNNMTIEKTGHGDTNGAWNKHAIIFSSPVEMTDVTVNNSVAVQAGAALTNVTINEANGYYGLWINGNGQTVTVNGGSITATNGGRGIKIADQYIDTPAQVALTVDGTVFNTAKKAAVLVSSKAGAQITASNYNIDNVAADPVNFVWVDEDWAQYFAEVEVTGATKAQEGNGFVAQRSNGASYKTLAAAITAATSGETITLIGDVKESVTIGKNINIDGKDHTITGTITLQGSNIVSEVKNVNFDGDNKTLYYAFSVRNTKNLTITDCTVKNYFSGLFYAPKSSTNVTVKDVTVEDCGEYLAYMVSLNNATFENVTIKGSESGLLVTNSGPKNVTLKNCTMTDVDMPIEIKEKATANITVIFEGVNEMGKAEFYESQYVNVVAAAQVGTKVCGSLDTAFDEAKDGETVKMLGNVTLDTKGAMDKCDGYATFVCVEGKAVTLDLNGKNITANAADADLANAKSKMLLGVFSTDNGGKLTFVDSKGTATVTLNANDAKVYSLLCNYEDGCQIKVEGGTYVADKVIDSMLYTGADEGENQGITVNGGNFTLGNVGEGANGKPWIFNVLGGNVGNVVVNGGTFNADVNHQFWANEVFVPETKALKNNGDGTWTVVDAVAYTTEWAASTGSSERNVGYATLAEAVEAAVEDGYVTLLADATGAGVVINKSITIDFGGHTYTVNKAVGSKGTETLGLQILKDNYVTLTNGTLTSTAVVEGKEVKMLVQNYANLTLEDMNLVDATDHIQYALSNNSGATFLTRNTNITTNAVAFDSYYSKSYDAPTVYVETEGCIKGAIEKNNGATIAISSGTFTAEIRPEWCAEYYAPVQNADGTWTVDYRYIDELTIVDDGKYTYDFVNDMTVGEFTYTRTFPAVNLWQTAYFPFEIPVEVLVEKGYEVGYFYDIHFEFNDGEINMDMAPDLHVMKVKSGTLRANYPYVIKPTADADLTLVLEFEDVVLHSVNDMKTVESSSTVHTFEFAGLYTRTLCSEFAGEAPCYTITTKGKFNKISKTANLTSLRVYMTIKAKDGSPVIFDETNAPEYIRMRVIGEENEDGTTTIYDVNAEEAEEIIFDLSGRRVLETEKGIYIKNGKKVYVK